MTKNLAEIGEFVTKHMAEFVRTTSIERPDDGMIPLMMASAHLYASVMLSILGGDPANAMTEEGQNDIAVARKAHTAMVKVLMNSTRTGAELIQFQKKTGKVIVRGDLKTFEEALSDFAKEKGAAKNVSAEAEEKKPAEEKKRMIGEKHAEDCAFCASQVTGEQATVVLGLMESCARMLGEQVGDNWPRAMIRLSAQLVSTVFVSMMEGDKSKIGSDEWNDALQLTLECMMHDIHGFIAGFIGGDGVTEVTVTPRSKLN